MLTNICCLNHTISKVRKKFLCKQLNSISSSCWWKYLKQLFSPHAISTLSFWWRREARERENSCARIIWIRVHFSHPIENVWTRRKCNKIDYVFNFNTFQFLFGLFSFLTGILNFLLYFHIQHFSFAAFWALKIVVGSDTNTLKWMSVQEENDRKQIRRVNDVK